MHIAEDKKNGSEKVSLKNAIKVFEEKAKELHEGFKIDKFNDNAITQAIDTIIKNEKGILLAGCVGSGKTSLMQILRPLASFGMVSCRHVARDFSTDGGKILDKYGRYLPTQPITGSTPGTIKDYCFDDLGEEKNSKFYGVESNVMAEIIQDRYEYYLSQGAKTHFTTNLKPEEIENEYGDRVWSRLKEMCHIIYLGQGENIIDRRTK